MPETKLTKSKYIPFLDTHTSGDTAQWTRIDKSTIFSLNPNPQTEQRDYICMDAPVTEVDHYEPSLPQEIALYEGNPMYDFIADMFDRLPVGSAAVVPALICFAGTGKRAWMISECTIVLGELNTVDGKLSFTLNLGGDITHGTYEITSAGVVTFTEDTGSASSSTQTGSTTP